MTTCDWTFFDTDNASIYCSRCGKRLQITYPVRPLALAETIDAFTSHHVECEPKEEREGE